jgi:acyl-CoA synthetase (AMP-forming)/AMP-acid ligase II
MIAPSSPELLISACALSRLGYTVLMLSPRLAHQAFLALIRAVHCELIFISERLLGSTKELQDSVKQSCQVLVLQDRSNWKQAFKLPTLANRQELSAKMAVSGCYIDSLGLD